MYVCGLHTHINHTVSLIQDNVDALVEHDVAGAETVVQSTGGSYHYFAAAPQLKGL